ncbi:thioredoxin family protein [Thermodesulfobacteriota bacterium]
MVTRLSSETINNQLQEAQLPVLLACLQQDFDYKEQMDILENVSEVFTGKVNVCLVELGDVSAAISAYKIEGTPTFVMFDHGRERDRLLGKADSLRLTTFVTMTLEMV